MPQQGGAPERGWRCSLRPVTAGVMAEDQEKKHNDQEEVE